MNLKNRCWAAVNPGLHVGDAANPFNQVFDFGEVCIYCLICHQLHVSYVEEKVEVSPGESIPHHELSAPALQLLLQLPHASGDVCLQELLLSSGILGMVERIPGIQ